MMSPTATAAKEENNKKASPTGANGTATNAADRLPSSSSSNTPPSSSLRPGLLSNHLTSSASSLSTNAMTLSSDPAACSTRSLGSTTTNQSGSSNPLWGSPGGRTGKVRRTVAATRPGAVSVMPGEPEERVTTTGLLPRNSLVNNGSTTPNQSTRSLSEHSSNSSRMLKARRTTPPATVPGAVHVPPPSSSSLSPTTSNTNSTMMEPPALTTINSSEQHLPPNLSTIHSMNNSNDNEDAHNNSTRSLMTTTSMSSNNSGGLHKPPRGTSAIRPGAVHVLPDQITTEPSNSNDDTDNNNNTNNNNSTSNQNTLEDHQDTATVSSKSSGGKGRRNTGTMIPGAVAVSAANETDLSMPPSVLTTAERDLLDTKTRVRGNNTMLNSTTPSITLPGAVSVTPSGESLVPPAVLAAVERDLVEVKSRKGSRPSGATIPGAVAVGPTEPEDAMMPPPSLSAAETDLHGKTRAKGARNTGATIPGAVHAFDNDAQADLDIPAVLSDCERDLENKTRGTASGVGGVKGVGNTGTMTPGAVHVLAEEPDALTPPASLADIERELMQSATSGAASGSNKLRLAAPGRRLMSGAPSSHTLDSASTTSTTTPGVHAMSAEESMNSLHRFKDPRSLALAERRRSSALTNQGSMSNIGHASAASTQSDTSMSMIAPNHNDGLTDHQRMEAKVIRMEQEEEARSRLRDMAANSSMNSPISGRARIATNNASSGYVPRPAPPTNSSYPPPPPPNRTFMDQGVASPPMLVSGTTQLPPRPPQVEDNNAINNNRNKGLAVAVAVTEQEEDEDDHMTRVTGVEYDPNAKPPLLYHRRCRLYTLVGCALILAVIAGALGAVLSKSSSSSAPTGPTLAPTTVAEQSYLNLFQQVVRNDLVYQPNTPHNLAANWIMFQDPMHLPVDSDHLIQRFLMVLFYYQMSHNGQKPWVSCNPPQIVPGANDTCIYASYELVTQVVNETSDQEYQYLPKTGFNRWVSGTHECTWAGALCDQANTLRSIELFGQNLTGTLPTEIAAIPFLEGFSVPFNLIEGTIPSEYATTITHLVSLELHYNQLTGTFSTDWFQATTLLLLNLGGNALTGSLTSEIALLTGLKGLHLFENKLTGTLPTEIGKLKYLSNARWNNNKFYGTIPTELGNLTSMQELWLYSNRLTGTIPTQLGLMTSMTDLEFNDNLLDGTIPNQLYNLTNLVQLELSDMNLTGTISPLIGALTNLEFFRIRRNHLTGTVPTQMGSLSSLKMVWLHLNQMKGSIPTEFCAHRGLAVNGMLQVLEADCNPVGNAPQECECCSSCCDRSTNNCLKVTS